MAVKTTLTLDSKASYDLLVSTLEDAADALKRQMEEQLALPAQDRMVPREARELASRHMALETLIKQVS